MMAPIRPERKSVKSAERTRVGAKRLLGGEEEGEDGAHFCARAGKRCLLSARDAAQDPLSWAVEEPTGHTHSCWTSPAPAAAAPTAAASAHAAAAPAPAPTTAPAPAQADNELQALLPYLTPSEVRVLGFLEMSASMLRGECQRCAKAVVGPGGPGVPGGPGGEAGDPCLCRVLAEDHFFRDARANLARQLREAARQRRTAHIAANGGGQGAKSCLGLSNRHGAAGEQETGTWDWLTQLQACMPSLLQQPLPSPLPSSLPSSLPPSLPFSLPPSSLPSHQPPPSGMGANDLAQMQARDMFGGGGAMAQMGNRMQYLAPRAVQEQPPPAHWGFTGSAHALPTATQFSAPQSYPGQQTAYGQQGGFSPQGAFGQQPSFQQLNFAQGAGAGGGQQQNYMQPQAQQGAGGGFMATQEQYMAKDWGQFGAANQFGGLSGGGFAQAPPAPQTLQHFAPAQQMLMTSPHFAAPNQCSMYPNQQLQQHFLGQQAACPMGPPCPMGQPFMGASPQPFCSHVLCGPPQVH